MDRISRLPDELLIHILSFLDTQHAVATSILSSRWIRLWKSVPVLDFNFYRCVRYYIDHDDSLYLDEANYMEKRRRIKCQRGKRERRFLGLVEKVLLLNRSPNISLFRLRFSDAYHDYTDEIGEWVQYAFARNVVEVDIYTAEHGCSEDRCLRIGPCHTLEILRIDVDFDIVLEGPSLVFFPNLKELHLKFRYDGLGSLARLFTGLPRLQVLWLSVESVIVDDATDLPSERRDLRFNFSGTALKSVYFDWLEQFNGIRYLNIVIDAPNLEYLHLQNNFAATYMIKNQPVISEVLLDTELVEGGVSNNGLGDDFDYAAGDFSYQSIIGILQVICNTNVLSIHECIMMALSRCGHNKLPVFHSLTKLTLDLHCSSWNLFLHFLHSCPNLKFLIVEEGYMAVDDIEGLVSWSQPESVPSCLLFHLKELGMKGVRSPLKEKVVTYIEKNAKVLEKITIDPYSSF